jgi:hypothetical protein
MEEYGLTVVQEDNAPGHMGYSVNCRIRNKVSTLWWPPNSPDMNPIETFWRDMKREIQKQVPRITKEADMITFVQEHWKKIGKERMEQLIKTMPERLDDCIAAKGGYTKW